MKNDAGKEEKRRYKFPQEFRLKKSEEFRTVIEKGKKRVFPNFVVFFLPNGLNHLRLGITVSKSIGKAHVRNRIKRLLREYFRLNQYEYRRGVDIVVIARKGAGEAKFSAVKQELDVLKGEL